ncbi:MAG: hypothetical protein JXB10_12575 [Pirellulales bacterium]|nr:hypothetical protein [Pirellulales bacterium]
MKRLFILLSAFFLLPGTVRPAPDPPDLPTCFPQPDPVYFCAAVEEDHPWIFRPSYFSHNPQDGSRVAQYQAPVSAYRPDDPTYIRSGYRHNQIIIQGSYGSADRLHVVETWGRGDQIRPYGEWLFPYRAGATPYGPWGNPQGPWTMPFDSWVNPYGLGQLPWGSYYPPYPGPYPGPRPYSNNQGPYLRGSYGGPSGPQGGYPGYSPTPYGGPMLSAPPAPEE